MSLEATLDASLIIYTARLNGLVDTLQAAAQQRFSGAWEVVIVDGACYARREAIARLWQTFCHELRPSGSAAIPLVHVPPLKPIDRAYYRSWDIPLYQHTGWVYAQGRVIVQTEDYCTFEADWLGQHTNFVQQHPNLVSIGDFFTADTGLTHYGRKTCKQTLEEWTTAFPDLGQRFNNPTVFHCCNADAYGYWISGNTGMALQHVMQAGPFTETPSHYPEAVNVPQLFLYGLSMWPLIGVPVMHHQHPSGGILDQVIVELDAYSNPCSLPVKQQRTDEAVNETARRDIIAERKRLNRWTF